MMIGLIPAARCSAHDRAQTASTPSAPYACSGHLACAQDQFCVDLFEWLPCVWIKQRHGCRKEAFLVQPGDGATVSAVSQIGEMGQEFRGVIRVSAFHDGFLPVWGICARASGAAAGQPLTPRAVTTADLDEELIGGTGDHSPYRL